MDLAQNTRVSLDVGCVLLGFRVNSCLTMIAMLDKLIDVDEFSRYLAVSIFIGL